MISKEENHLITFDKLPPLIPHAYQPAPISTIDPFWIKDEDDINFSTYMEYLT